MERCNQQLQAALHQVRANPGSRPSSPKAHNFATFQQSPVLMSQEMCLDHGPCEPFPYVLSLSVTFLQTRFSKCSLANEALCAEFGCRDWCDVRQVHCPVSPMCSWNCWGGVACVWYTALYHCTADLAPSPAKGTAPLICSVWKVSCIRRSRSANVIPISVEPKKSLGLVAATSSQADHEQCSVRVLRVHRRPPLVRLPSRSRALWKYSRSKAWWEWNSSL